MPFFKSNENIFKKPWEDEVYKLIQEKELFLPPSEKWTYERNLKIEDVNIWEVLYEASGGVGVYASWDPYAEFYMITLGWVPNTGGINLSWRHGQLNRVDYAQSRIIELYYGPGSSIEVENRVRQLGWPVFNTTVWVDDEDMWLHQPPENTNQIIRP